MNISKKAKYKIQRTRPPKDSFPTIIENLSNPHINKVGTHTFTTGTQVGIFDITDYRALTQLIGYAKFKNTNYGDVFYRGEAHLHNTLLPSIARKTTTYKYEESLSNTIQSAISDPKFSKFAKLSGFKGRNSPSLVAEATLQHYGYSTHFIDVVDNHWVALWFGLNSYKKIKNLKEYYFYEQRTVNPIELIKNCDSRLNPSFSATK